MIAGLLMMFNVWEPKDPAVKKWLRNGVVISIVGAVGAFGVRQFAAPSGPPSQPTARPAQPSEPIVAPSGPGLREPPRSPPRAKAPSQPDPDAPPSPAIPVELQAWAMETLGPRPMLQADAEQQYPSCVSRLSNAGQDAEDNDALSCRRDLHQFHMDVIVAYYDAKRPYDRKLEAQEAALRKAGVQTVELPKYNYVIAEMDRLNGTDSAEENAVHSLEERVLGDIRRCSQSPCR
jgi:hypothetical protein